MKIYPHQIIDMRLKAIKIDKNAYNLSWFRVSVVFKDHVIISNQPVRQLFVDLAPGIFDSKFYGEGKFLKQLEMYAIHVYRLVQFKYKFKQDQVKTARVKIWENEAGLTKQLLIPVVVIKKSWLGMLTGELDLSGKGIIQV